MVEEQVEVEGFVADHKLHLAADEGKAATEFEQQIAEVDQQAAFEFPFLEVVRQGQKVEVVGIAQDMLGLCPNSQEAASG